MSAITIATRPLGRSGPLVPRLGLGLMSVSGFYGMPAADDSRLAFLSSVFAAGETFWDTADEYADSEDLLGKWFAANPGKRSSIFLASKFAIRRREGAQINAGLAGVYIDSSPEYCKQAIEKSLRRLGTDYVDLYYVHRLDGKTPIEKTMQAMVELKQAGKIRNIGLSECSAESLRRAHKVHPVAAVQVEYNPFCLHIERPTIRLLETARELGVAVVSFSPLAHGFVAGNLRKREDVLKEGDMRGHLEWMSEENFEGNVKVMDRLAEIAARKKITPAQLTLAWIMAQGDECFAIPGTTKIHRVEENLRSMAVTLTPEEEKEIREVAAQLVGERFQTKTGYAFADTPALE